MTPSWNESPVSLEKLDAHLKALLRLKIREFVHLSPCFKDTPTVDPSLYASAQEQQRQAMNIFATPDNCPHTRHQGKHGRRRVRTAVAIR